MTPDEKLALKKRAKELRGLLFDEDLRQQDVADAMGVTQGAVSQFLNAHKHWPEDFEPRFRRAVSVLSRARRRA